MDSLPPRDGPSAGVDAPSQQPTSAARRQSSSQDSHTSEGSHTALDFIRSQMQLEADAREALPYSIESCTKPLGRLRQSVFACLTCNPPPAASSSESTNNGASANAAGVCYACSVQCHGEHTLVELFNKRNFTCDCGTTRFPSSAPCNLRVNPETNTKGGVHSETPDAGNQYNQNFRNRFCGCALDYDPFQQKGTMFQCLGLGTTKTGGCGEDWWHPGCVVGLGPKWFEGETDGQAPAVPKQGEAAKKADKTGAESGGDNGEAVPVDGTPDALPTISEDAEDEAAAAPQTEEAETREGSGGGDEEDEPPMPPGFPKEEDFDGFICYKCVDAYPWIRQYAGSPGFLTAVLYKEGNAVAPTEAAAAPAVKSEAADGAAASRKRKAEDDADVDATEAAATQEAKRVRADASTAGAPEKEANGGRDGEEAPSAPLCKRKALPPPPSGRFSLFFTESFRDHLCRCNDCFPLLTPHPQLLEEEETYEPPVSEDGSQEGRDQEGDGASGRGSGRSHGSGSLYERGESALRNVDRVRAIEGVMAYNHLKDKLKPFFQQFAESGQAISAEDIKAYFAKLRGDEQAIQEAGEAAKSADNRREQSGF